MTYERSHSCGIVNNPMGYKGSVAHVGLLYVMPWGDTA